MVVVTIAGIVIALVQISHAKDAVLKTERADVLIETVGFVTPPPLTSNSVMEVTLRNYGRTRANELVVEIWQGMSASDKLEERPIQVTTLGAGATASPRFPRLGSCLTQEGFAAVMKGEETFRYGGTVSYKDVFGQKHTLKCSGTYNLAHAAFLIDENSSD